MIDSDASCAFPSTAIDSRLPNGPSSSTSLDRLETTPPRQTFGQAIFSHPSRSDVCFRHSGWSRTRNDIGQAFHRLRITDSRQQRFAACGADAWVIQNPANHSQFAVVASYCHDRFCLPCARARAATIRSNLAEHLERGPYRFVTLTLKTGTEPLADSLDRLYTSFVRLRRRKLWQSTVTGGAAFLEVTWCAATNRWHPHLHVICEGGYIPQPMLRADWLAVTGDSFIVDVRFIRDQGQALSYIVKYGSKPLSNTYMRRPGKLDEAINAMSGRKLCATFGTWQKWQLLKTPDPRQWTAICPLGQLITLAREGNDAATRIIATLSHNQHWEIDTPAKEPP